MDYERRRRQPPNRWGCKPIEDVCLAHDAPLECRHGCEDRTPHQCSDAPEIQHAQPAREDG